MRWLIVVCLLSFGCSPNQDSTGILSQDKMRKIVFDLIRTDEYTSNYLTRDTSVNLQKERLKLYDKVFVLHHTTKDQFYKSYRYYEQHPDQQKEIFDSLGKWTPISRERPKVTLVKDSISK
jgi:hypothetical protein